MCNFCDFQNITDVEHLAQSNPWSAEVQCTAPCHSVDEDRELEFPLAESVLTGMIPERTSSRGKTKRRQRPSNYPSFRISTISMEPDEVGILGAYEVNRRSTVRLNAGAEEKRKSFSLSRHFSISSRPSVRRSNVSFSTSPTEMSPRSSTSTWTPDPPSPSESFQAGYFTPRRRVPSSNASSLSDRESQRYSTRDLISLIDQEIKSLA